MKLLSLSSTIHKARETFLRFPLPLLSALGGTIVMLCFMHKDFSASGNQMLLHLGMTLYLSMLFTISVSLYAERFTFSGVKKYAAFSISLAVVAIYYFSLPAAINAVTWLRFVLFTIGLHLLVSFSPLLVREEMNGLWQFNKSLFIRILIGGIYSAVLFGGLALALLAVDNLFEIKINEKYYRDLWIVIAGIFNTWFFLSGVPHNIPSLEDVDDYPKGLKIFTGYVLLPLITVYLVILYLYAGKILITAHWPVGWVGYMVIAFAVFGILSFLLIYPLRNDEANPWVKFYSRLFYFLLLLPIVLLFAAIFKRVNQYGITEERYFVIVLALWLSFITLYFIFTNGKNIRIIPVTLCLVAFLSSFGPWGAFSISHNSQMNELTLLLDSNRILKDGKADTSATHDVNSKDYERITSIVRYINNMHGHDKLQSYFFQSLDLLIAEDKKDNSSMHGENNLILALFRMNKIISGDEESSHLYYKISGNAMLNARGYDFVKEFYVNYRNDDFSRSFNFGSDSIRFVYAAQNGTMKLTCRDFEPLLFQTNEMLASLSASDKDAIAPDRLTLETENPQWKAKIIFTSVNFDRAEGTLRFDNANGVLMLRINNALENEVGEKATK
ncbi:MAG: DUF4153 domain-containing protein [Bacteroidia bacterium]|nr:DUF4153 domain-containing protein [Bacteroidia bacterium]